MTTFEQSHTQLSAELALGLQACATEADLVQVLYGYLQPLFHYDVINMHVLEHEGWYHSVIVERGVLQDVIRRRVAESSYGHLYRQSRATVVNVGPGSSFRYVHSRGPGARKLPRRAIWVPITHQSRAIGAVIYQLFDDRPVPAAEIELLGQVQAQLGVLVHNAHLNALSRDQAIRLGALNAIARALSATRSEGDVVSALHSSLGQLLPLHLLELAVIDERAPERVRLLSVPGRGVTRAMELARQSRRLERVRRSLAAARPQLGPRGATASAPLLEGGCPRGALVIHGGHSGAYEPSTLVFLEQVAHEVVLALRNAWSYAALEAQRRRLVVVNAAGRRLASSLDVLSILRTLREELTRHLSFDAFSLLTVEESGAGSMLAGYVDDSGKEQAVPPAPMRRAGPARQVYETGRSVLIRRSASTPLPGRVRRPRRTGARDQGRSQVWVPARSGDRVVALLSLQSYDPDAFDEWHVQLLEDVAAHVGLALANAAHFSSAQAERRRLEAVHDLDMAVATAGDERQIAEAFFHTARSFLGREVGLLLAHLEGDERLAGWRAWDREAARPLGGRTGPELHLLRRLAARKRTTTLKLEPDQEIRFWRWSDPRAALSLIAAPIRRGDRVAGVIAAGRIQDVPFTDHERRFLENAAPVLAIALRTVRLHAANEMALAHSVRIQEVAGLAGHDLQSVASSVAEQARAMLQATGTACWAFDVESDIIATGHTGDPSVRRVLIWSGRAAGRTWSHPPRAPLSSSCSRGTWTLIPLWYGDRLVGAIGAVRPAHALQELGSAATDFARHAAVAIENARLARETRDRIRALEAIAAFGDLDVSQPERARAELGMLIAEALGTVGGELWRFEDQDLVSVSSPNPRSMPMPEPGPFLTALRSGRGGRLFQRALRQAGLQCLPGEMLVVPVPVAGRIGGLLSAGWTEARAETRRLMLVLAGQAGILLTRIELVAELEREAKTMEAILQHSPVGVVLEHGDGRVAFASKAIERLYGVPIAGLVGRRLQELYQRSGAVVIDEEGESTIPAAPIVLRLRERMIEVRRVQIPGSGDQPERALTLHDDVTHERGLQEAKDLMLRAIGHEVRSPAAAMRTTIASLISWHGVMTPAQSKGLLESAYDQSQRLLTLVEGQLIVAQLETGSFVPNPQLAPLEPATKDALALLRYRYGDRTELIGIDIPARLPAALCEPTHLGQVLVNLLANALEYGQGQIWLSAGLRQGWIEVAIRDQGPGVASDQVETLFTKLVPAGRKRARGGLGLGLYLCWLVVERSFGGRIWLDRTGPGGSTFKFTVRAAKESARLSGGTDSSPPPEHSRMVLDG